MRKVATESELPPGSVTGSGEYAVGNNGDYFAVTRRCRHLRADLADGTIDADGCLVCPWHGAKYDVDSGRMTGGPQGIFAKIPGLSGSFKLLTRVVPLGEAKSAYSFTMFKAPGMPDDLFESQYESLRREFDNIRARFAAEHASCGR